MKIILRPARFLDIDEMMEVNQACLQENYTKEFWIDKFNEGKIHCFVATAMNRVIGYIFCDNNTVLSFAIMERYRGKSVGKNLMYHCLNTFKTPVGLHVRVTNDVALKLYKSLEFVEKEKIYKYYSNPIEDAYLMERKPNGSIYPETKKMNIQI
jgi:[ribosomal protein S18]-alanine N-acetyltransferase